MSDIIVINPQGQVEDVSDEADPVTRVFGIAEVRDKILSQYPYVLSPEDKKKATAELFKLRLVSRSFNESVLTCKEGIVRPLNVARIGILGQPSFIPRRLEEEELNLLDHRLCRVIKAMGGPLPRQPQDDSAGKNQNLVIYVQNLMDICVARGEWILELNLETPSSHLLQVMEVIDNHCPNIQRLEVQVGLLSSPMTPDDDKEFSFQPKPALTKLSLIFRTGDNQDVAVDSNNHMRRVTVALLKAVPNLRSFKLDSPAFMMLDLSACQAIQDLTFGSRSNRLTLLDHQLRSLSESISACCETLENLNLFYDTEEDEEGAEYVPYLLPSFPNLRTLSLDITDDDPKVDPLARPLLTLVMEGRAPLLRELRFLVGNYDQNADDILKLCLSACESGPAVVSSLEKLDLYDIKNTKELPPMLQTLRRIFPNIKQLTVRCLDLSMRRGELIQVHQTELIRLDPYLATAFREMKRWEHLKDVSLTFTSGSISIFQLHQLLGMLGEGFFRTWELTSFEFGSVFWAAPNHFDLDMIEGHERRFRNQQLELFKNRLMWMGHMKKSPPMHHFDVLAGLRSFVQENHLPIHFGDTF